MIIIGFSVTWGGLGLPTSCYYWVAFKELKSSYHNCEPHYLLYTHIFGNLEQQPCCARGTEYLQFGQAEIPTGEPGLVQGFRDLGFRV